MQNRVPCPSHPKCPLVSNGDHYFNKILIFSLEYDGQFKQVNSIYGKEKTTFNESECSTPYNFSA